MSSFFTVVSRELFLRFKNDSFYGFFVCSQTWNSCFCAKDIRWVSITGDLDGQGPVVHEKFYLSVPHVLFTWDSLLPY